VISEAQHEDTQLLEIAHNNQEYSTKTLLHHPVIHYKNKIVVPQSLQKQVIKWYHNTLLHPRINRTTKGINQHFHWKNLMSNIKKHCEACNTCAHYKKYTQQYGILPTKTNNPNPWTKVCVDMLGPWTIPQDDKKKKKKATCGISRCRGSVSELRPR
jgi:Integrase zinc binding domain